MAAGYPDILSWILKRHSTPGVTAAYTVSNTVGLRAVSVTAGTRATSVTVGTRAVSATAALPE